MKKVNNMILFWGTGDLFSNFHRTKFEHRIVNNKTNSKSIPIPVLCSEQAFMIEKAFTFKDPNSMRELMNLTLTHKDLHPNEFGKLAKMIGRKVENYDDDVWSKCRYQVMVNVLINKFSDPSRQSVLLKTYPNIIVEASPYDNIWGIGLGQDDPKAYSKSSWQGQNLLGKALMEVREFYIKKNDLV